MRRSIPVTFLTLSVALAAAACSGSDSSVFPQTSIVEAEVQTGPLREFEVGCADVTVTIDGVDQVFDAVETPWAMEFTVQTPAVFELFACATCTNCSLPCDPNDGTAVGISIDGTGQVGRGTPRGCAGASWNVPS